MKASRSEFIEIDGLRMHVRRWGREGAPRLFMLHGWMDSSITFQFVVDAFKHEWDVVALDWRGYGLSEWNNSTYWYPDYLADLEVLLDHYSAGQPATLIGHSMGASVVGMMAGLRPERVKQLIMLDGYGVPPQPEGAETMRLSDWMKGRNGGVPEHRGYADVAEFARRLCQANPRLSAERADFLAANFSGRNGSGRIVAAADPWHRLNTPLTVKAEDHMQIWRRITAPVLWVVADDSYLFKRFENKEAEYRARLACFASVQEVVLHDIGHNLHHDVPERVAELIEEFLSR